MRYILLQLVIMLSVPTLFAQWIPVNNGLPDFPPTTLCSWVDTMIVSTYGGGIYLTYDNGGNWMEMPGTIPNLFVNKIQYSGGQFDPISVSTEGGPFICVNGGYIDCNGTGLTNSSVNWWASGYGGIVKDAIAGTNGDGVFAADYTSPFIYDWSPANPGITGNGLFVYDGVVGVNFALIATDGGMYQVLDNETEWSSISSGLSGDALKVRNICYLGSAVLIATQGGLYYTLNIGNTWLPVIPYEKFNIVYYLNTDISPSGYMCYAFGENGYYTEDFINWTQLDLGAGQGEVTAAQADEANLYIGFTADDKGSGGIYRKPLEQFVVGVNDNIEIYAKTHLNQNYPNPFSETTKISYSLDSYCFVSLKVYNVFGKEIKIFVNEFQSSGTYTITFDARNLDEGVYFYTLHSGSNISETKRMILIR